MIFAVNGYEPRHAPKVYAIDGQEARTNRFRSEMLHQIGDAVVAVDSEERVTYLNAAAERLYGLSASSSPGLPLTAIRTSEWARPEARAAAMAAIRAQGEWHGEHRHTLNNGRTVNIESSCTELRGRDGRAGGRLAVMREVTEREKHEAKVLVSECLRPHRSSPIPISSSACELTPRSPRWRLRRCLAETSIATRTVRRWPRNTVGGAP